MVVVVVSGVDVVVVVPSVVVVVDGVDVVVTTVVVVVDVSGTSRQCETVNTFALSIQ